MEFKDEILTAKIAKTDAEEIHFLPQMEIRCTQIDSRTSETYLCESAILSVAKTFAFVALYDSTVFERLVWI